MFLFSGNPSARDFREFRARFDIRHRHRNDRSNVESRRQTLPHGTKTDVATLTGVDDDQSISHSLLRRHEKKSVITETFNQPCLSKTSFYTMTMSCYPFFVKLKMSKISLFGFSD